MKTGFIIGPEDVSNRTWREYCNFRIRNSTIVRYTYASIFEKHYLYHFYIIIYRYWYHSDLEPDDANAVVTTAFIVNAVILTIPFGVLPVFNNGYWDYFFCQMQLCQGGNKLVFDECLNGIYLNDEVVINNSLVNGYGIYLSTIYSIYTCTYCSIMGLLLGSLFFIFVPNDRTVFKIWWQRGRIVLGMIILSMLSAIGGLMNLIKTTLPFAVQSSNYGCLNYIYMNNHYCLWSIILGFVLFITITLSF